IQFRSTGITVTLKKGIESAVTFRRKNDGKEFTVLYNRAFTRLPTLSQKPDNVVEILGPDSIVVLDAKYRFGHDEDYRSLYCSPGPLPEDINVMHRYRDAIVTRDLFGPGRSRRVVSAAIVLIPLETNEAY